MYIYCNMRLSIFLGWHKVMESIDCALELGYDPVKVNFSSSTDLLFKHISTGCSQTIQKKGDGVGARTLVDKIDTMTEIYGLLIHKPPQFRSTQTKRASSFMESSQVYRS